MMASQEAAFPIGYVSRMTGLSANLVRAWERRYAVVTPQRSDSNRRLYSLADVERLQLLSALVADGHRISLIARLDSAVLLRLRLREAVTADAGAVGSRLVEGQWSVAQRLKAAMTAVENMDAPALESELQSAAVGMPRLKVLMQVVSPLLERIGRQWSTGALRIAQEHAATAAVQGHLMAMLAAAQPPDGAPVLVAGTPSGQRCTLGSLMAAVVAADRGWRVHYLGAELPAEEFVAAVRGCGASALALSIVLAVQHAEVLRVLKNLQAAVGGDVAIHVGGAGASTCRDAIAAMGLQYHESLKDFAAACDYSYSAAGSPAF